MAVLEVKNSIANIYIEYNDNIDSTPGSYIVFGFGSEPFLTFQRCLFTLNENIPIANFKFRELNGSNGIFTTVLNTKDKRVFKMEIDGCNKNCNPKITITKCSSWSNSELSQIINLKDALINMSKSCSAIKVMSKFHTEKVVSNSVVSISAAVRRANDLLG